MVPLEKLSTRFRSSFRWWEDLSSLRRRALRMYPRIYPEAYRRAFSFLFIAEPLGTNSCSGFTYHKIHLDKRFECAVTDTYARV